MAINSTRRKWFASGVDPAPAPVVSLPVPEPDIARRERPVVASFEAAECDPGPVEQVTPGPAPEPVEPTRAAGQRPALLVGAAMVGRSYRSDPATRRRLNSRQAAWWGAS